MSFFDKVLSASHPRHLWKRYAIAVALIAVLVSTSHFAAMRALGAHAKNAELINMAGRQRMLSQRIMYLGLRASHHPDDQTITQLDAGVSLLLESQTHLAGRSRLSADLLDLYDGSAQLNTRVADFSEIGRTIADHPGEEHDHLEALLAFNSEALLNDLDRAAFLFEAMANRDAKVLERIEQASFYAALLVLMIEAIIIFVPAQRLVTRTIAALETQSDIATQAKIDAIKRNRELESLKDKVEHDALHDALTGLPNRRALEAILMHLKQNTMLSDRVHSLLHVDLDRFKQINDTLGHAAGDHVLKHVAKTLKACTRPDDFVARIGGDEFVILPAPDTAIEDLSALAQRVITAIRRPEMYQSNICHTGASIGISLGSLDAVADGAEPSDLLVEADIALYRAKELGRGRFAFFTPELADEVAATKRTSDELLDALRKAEFRVHYQPIYRARHDQISSIEALVRWQHPTKGVLSAQAFIDHAQRLGLGAEIDFKVLNMIENDVVTAREAGVELPPIAINVSASSLKQGTILRQVSKSPLVAHGLSLEISESVDFDSDIERITAQLQAVRRRGVRIEIDDFGTGHASIFSFQRIEPDRIKIARELLSDVTRSDKTRQLIRSTCQLAKSFGAQVVAEGAEDMDMARTLAALGCDFIQGYGLSRPKPLDQLILELTLTRAEPEAKIA